VVVPSAREGRVTESKLGEVIIDIGRQHGVRHGGRIELSIDDSESVGDEVATRRSVLAVGVVETVAERFSRVRLGLNEAVPVGARARVVASGPAPSRNAPPRAEGLTEIGFRARPFVALDGLGGGLLTQAWVGYRFEAPLYVSAEINPFAYADGKQSEAVIPVAGTVNVAYDRDVFSIGLGFGGQTVKTTAYGALPGSGVLLAQRLRLGTRDGLHLDLRNDIVLFHSRFEFSGLIGAGQIPVGSGVWLLLEGGGGQAGWGYGEIGVRTLLRGNGGPGSVFFAVVLGGVTVFEEQEVQCGSGGFVFPCIDSTTYGGPMLGAGGEWRF
jgi:hypothetical protein